jgi:hypothetical protein
MSSLMAKYRIYREPTCSKKPSLQMALLFLLEANTMLRASYTLSHNHDTWQELLIHHTTRCKLGLTLAFMQCIKGDTPCI